MKRGLMQVGAIVALLLAATSLAAASTTRQKLASVQYLVGTWKCAHSVGTFSGSYTTTWTNTLDNLWLKQTYDFPARQFGGTEPAVHAEFLVGYDEGRQAWVRFGAISTGQYFAIRMTDTGDGWAWKYISFFPRSQPETPSVDATFTKKSDTQYIVDGPTYQENGTGPTVTEHHDCKKL